MPMVACCFRPCLVQTVKYNLTRSRSAPAVTMSELVEKSYIVGKP